MIKYIYLNIYLLYNYKYFKAKISKKFKNLLILNLIIFFITTINIIIFINFIHKIKIINSPSSSIFIQLILIYILALLFPKFILQSVFICLLFIILINLNIYNNLKIKKRDEIWIALIKLKNYNFFSIIHITA